MQIENSGDSGLQALEKELTSYPGPATPEPHEPDAAHNIAVPLRVRMGDQVLSFISTITVFGTPLDVTLSELAIESFFPADAETGDYLRQPAAAT